MKKIFGVGFILVTSLVLAVFYSLSLSKRTAKVVRIVDGDTIEIDKSISPKGTVRLIGIDAPEKDECFYQDSINELTQLLLNKYVRFEQDTNTLDEYGRALVYIFVDDLFVNEFLLEKGIAKFGLDRINKKYADRLVYAAESGYKIKGGLWISCAVSGVSCVIKGNLDVNDKKFYHLPFFRHYASVVINFEHGDQWFCTEEEALRAGFTRARE
ncbi:thermonuclease family protein [Candidatus Roizmanbacteria bacterium]|nr:thermonuclease family protein [Candidatus Roizmanbacteria bacterium]